MKYVLIVLMGAFLTGCGGVNQWNHNRIRKVKVVHESSETTNLKPATDRIEFQSDLTIENLMPNDDVLVEELDQPSSEQAIEEIAKEEKVEPTAARSINREDTKKLEIKKTKKSKVEYRSKGARMRISSGGFEWDWLTFGVIAIPLAVVALIVLGIIYFSTFGTVLLIIACGIITLCTLGICLFLFAL